MRSRSGRLCESARRLGEELSVEHEANTAYEAYRARGVMKDGRRFGARPKPYRPPQLPQGQINTTDPDSRVMKTFGRYALQGYNVQAAVNEHQILLASKVTNDAPDFGHLEPIVDATERELEAVGAKQPQPCGPVLLAGQAAPPVGAPVVTPGRGFTDLAGSDTVPASATPAKAGRGGDGAGPASRRSRAR